MERKLAEFTRMHMFDFNKVSADMQRYMTSQQFSRPDLFTSDVCRVHFAMMDFQQVRIVLSYVLSVRVPSE